VTLRYFQLRLSLKINIKPVCKKCYVGQPTSPFGANHCTERKPNKAGRLCASNLRTKKRCDGLQHSGRRNLPVLGLFDHDVSGSCPALWWSLCQPRFHLLAKKSWSLLVKAVPGPRTSSCVLSFVWWLPISLRPALLLSASMQLLASASWTRQRGLLDCDCAEIFVIGTRNCKMGKHFHTNVEKLSSLTRNWCTRHRDKVLFRAFDCNITEISISTIASASRHRRFMWRSEISLLNSEG